MDEKVLEVTNYQLSQDRKTVTFDVPLETNRVYAIQFPGQLNTEAKPLDFDTIYYTVNHLRPAKEPKPGRNVGWSLAGSSWSRNDKARPSPRGRPTARGTVPRWKNLPMPWCWMRNNGPIQTGNLIRME